MAATFDHSGGDVRMLSNGVVTRLTDDEATELLTVLQEEFGAALWAEDMPLFRDKLWTAHSLCIAQSLAWQWRRAGAVV